MTVLLLSGCAWVLPKPAPPAPPTEAVAAEYAACTLDLTEARKAQSTSIFGAGAAQPLVISLTDGPSNDRAIRDGSSVTLRRAAGGGGQAAREQAGVVSVIEAVGARRGAHGRIDDQSAVHLRISGSDGTTESSTGATAAVLADGDFVIYKADTPNPNRPSSCDAQLRDGDFVFLKSAGQNSWVGVRGGALVAEGARALDGAPCHTPREKCYTDRYGGLKCVNYFECAENDH
jgi:hypothetical protein